MNQLLNSFRDDPPPSEPPTSATLLLRVQSQDQSAWHRLVHLYSPLVERWCRRAALQVADVADVTQEVFLTVSHRIDEFRHQQPNDTFRGWLYVITYHKIGDHLRKVKRPELAEGGSEARLRLEGLPEQAPPEEEEADASSVLGRVLELIRPEFGERSWTMFWRATAGGEPTQRIADDLGVTADAVRMAKARILRRCREELAGLEKT